MRDPPVAALALPASTSHSRADASDTVHFRASTGAGSELFATQYTAVLPQLRLCPPRHHEPAGHGRHWSAVLLASAALGLKYLEAGQVPQ